MKNLNCVYLPINDSHTQVYTYGIRVLEQNFIALKLLCLQKDNNDSLIT